MAGMIGLELACKQRAVYYSARSYLLIVRNSGATGGLPASAVLSCVLHVHARRSRSALLGKPAVAPYAVSRSLLGNFGAWT